MRLRIGGYLIPERVLTSVSFIEGTPTVTFAGMAMEDDGRVIESKLRKLVWTNALQYDVVDQMGIHGAGVCSLANLKFETLSTSPKMVIFSGELILPSLNIES